MTILLIWHSLHQWHFSYKFLHTCTAFFQTLHELVFSLSLTQTHICAYSLFLHIQHIETYLVKGTSEMAECTENNLSPMLDHPKTTIWKSAVMTGWSPSRSKSSLPPVLPWRKTVDYQLTSLHLHLCTILKCQIRAEKHRPCKCTI